MLALDNAVAAELAAALPEGVRVYYASADRDDPLPYVVHRSTDSRPGSGVGFGADGREYEHSIIAASSDPDEAEALREAVGARLRGATIPVDGWGVSQKITWQGEVHDPGDLLPGGAIAYFAGDRWRIPIARGAS